MTVDNFGNLLFPSASDSINTIKKVKTEFNINPLGSTFSNEIMNSNCILTTLIENPKEYDADIEFEVGEMMFEAHKNILKAISPVFFKLLSIDFKEGKVGRVTIDDTTPEAFNALLNILYTGDKAKHCNDDVVCDLYFLAKKYLFEDLENYCEFQIRKSSAEYLIQRFIWADAHDSLSGLREFLKIQIVKKSKEIEEKHPDFIDQLFVHSVELGKELMKALMKCNDKSDSIIHK